MTYPRVLSLKPTETRTSEGEVRWHVLAANARWIADIDMPARFRLVEADVFHVTGLLRDVEDVEGVVVYRIRNR